MTTIRMLLPADVVAELSRRTHAQGVDSSAIANILIASVLPEVLAETAAVALGYERSSDERGNESRPALNARPLRGLGTSRPDGTGGQGHAARATRAVDESPEGDPWRHGADGGPQ